MLLTNFYLFFYYKNLSFLIQLLKLIIYFYFIIINVIKYLILKATIEFKLEA